MTRSDSSYVLHVSEAHFVLSEATQAAGAPSGLVYVYLTNKGYQLAVSSLHAVGSMRDVKELCEGLLGKGFMDYGSQLHVFSFELEKCSLWDTLALVKGVREGYMGLYIQHVSDLKTLNLRHLFTEGELRSSDNALSLEAVDELKELGAIFIGLEGNNND